MTLEQEIRLAAKHAAQKAAQEAVKEKEIALQEAEAEKEIALKRLQKKNLKVQETLKNPECLRKLFPNAQDFLWQKFKHFSF